MPVYFNKDTGLAESVDSPTDAHEVPLVSPKGDMGSASPEDAPGLLQQGFRQTTPQENTGLLKTAHFNEPLEQAKTVLEGGLDSATYGGSTAAEIALGSSPEDINSRKEANPTEHVVGQVAGLAASSLVPFGEGAVINAAGRAAAEALVGGGAKSLMGHMVSGAIRGAVENTLFQSQDEGSKWITSDPHQTAETAISNIGLGAVLGGVSGTALGTMKPGFKALAESKIGQNTADFANTIKAHFAPVAPEVEAAVKQSGWQQMLEEANKAPEDRGKLNLQADVQADVAPEVPVKKSLGTRAAEAVIEKGAGEVLGPMIGAKVAQIASGGVPGSGAFGAWLGEKYLSQRINSVLPSIMKSVVNMTPSGTGLRAAMDFGVEALNGEARLGKAMSNIFNASKIVVSEPDFKSTEKLKDKLDAIAVHPDEFQQVGGAIGHYMPDHAAAIGLTAARASKYLLSQKPENAQGAPLDAEMPLSKPQQANYNNALSIAQEPLQIASRIKDGSITLQDIQHLRSMYPALATSMERKLTNELITAKNKDVAIPYRTRLGVSMFMGNPMESSLKQGNIASIQATFTPPQPMQQGKPPSAAKMQGMQKLPSMSSLPSQTREASRSTVHK